MPRLRRIYIRRYRPGRHSTSSRPVITRKRLFTLLLLIAIVFSLLSFSRYLGEVSGEMAANEAKDVVVLSINEAIAGMMSDGAFSTNGFINVEKDENGNVTAITTNTARINTLSAQLLRDVVSELSQGKLNIKVPLGTLSGFQLLQGRGPNIPIKIHMLTASHATFRNELTAAGINQTRHQIILDVSIRINVLIPWKTMTTEVENEILVAETVIVGKVPDTVIDWK